MSQRNRIASILLVGLLAPLSAQAQFWCGNQQNPCPLDDAGKPTCYQQPPPNPACEECESCTRSPCYVGSGVYTTSVVDLQIPTTGFPLTLARSYSSYDRFDGPLGIGWSSSLLPRAHLATFLFSAPNVVQSEADIAMPNGARYRFKQNANGSFTPPAGRHDTLVRNADGSFDLTLQRSRLGYHFDADGSITSMTDDFGNRLDYTYDGSGALTRIADASGSDRFLDVFWGADGRLNAIVDHTGRSVEYRYDSGGKLIEVTDPLGRIASHFYTAGKHVPLLSQIRDNWDRVITTITYDTADRTKSYTDKGETWTYTYAYQGNESKTSKADSQGNLYVFTFDANGLVTSEVAPGGAAKATSYYAGGSVQQTTNEAGVKTFFTYDAQGRILSRVQDYQGPLAVRLDYTYDSQFPSNVLAITPKDPLTGQVNPLFEAKRFEYWPPGSPAPGAIYRAMRVRSDGATLDILTSYTYDSLGRITTVSDGAGATTDYGYDAEGNRVSISAPANNASGARPVTTYTYDDLGRVVAETDAAGMITSYSYDAVGRTTAIALPPPAADSTLDFTTTIDYDEFDSATGLVFTKTTDPNGVVTRIGEDAFGRARKRVDGVGAVTQWGYTRDLLTSLIDANGNATGYSHSNRKRLLSTVFPNGAVENRTHFADGALKSTTDRKNQTINYSYDRFGRPVTRTYPDASTITYTYSGQNLTQVADTSVSPTETHSFSYDSAYRLASETQGPRGTLVYEYAQGDRLSGYSVVDGVSASYSYFADGSVSAIEWSAVPGEFYFTYNLRGQPLQVLFPNGQQRAYAYDDQGRLLQVANTGPGAENVATFDYGYDMDYSTGLPQKLGQRTSLTTDFPAQGLLSALTGYYYDAAYQLVRVDYPVGPPFSGDVNSWTYDLIGNRTSASAGGATSTYTYQKIAGNANNWQHLQSDGSNTFAHDNNGSLVNKTGTSGNFSFAWNTDNRLTAVAGTDAATYRYDFLGRRTEKTLGGQTAWFVYRGENLIGEQGDGSANYLHGPEIDLPLAAEKGGEVFYSIVDGMGSVVGSVNESGQLQHSTTFDAWGVPRMEEGSRNFPFAFTGREFGEANAFYYRARSYFPQVGRFASVDPLGQLNGSSLYAYVDNNPTNFVDPYGLAKMCCRLVDLGFGKRHCYLIADDSTRYGLYPEGGITSGVGKPRTNDPNDSGGECYDCPARACESQDECLRNAHNAYPVGGYSLFPGPNSNSYAGALARSCCKGGVPSGVHDAPGINHPPPGSGGGGASAW